MTAPIIGATKLSHLTDALGRVIVSGVAAAVAWRQGAPDVIAEDGWVSRGGLLCAGVTLLAS